MSPYKSNSTIIFFHAWFAIGQVGFGMNAVFSIDATATGIARETFGMPTSQTIHLFGRVGVGRLPTLDAIIVGTGNFKGFRYFNLGACSPILLVLLLFFKFLFVFFQTWFAIGHSCLGVDKVFLFEFTTTSVANKTFLVKVSHIGDLFGLAVNHFSAFGTFHAINLGLSIFLVAVPLGGKFAHAVFAIGLFRLGVNRISSTELAATSVAE